LLLQSNYFCAQFEKTMRSFAMIDEDDDDDNDDLTQAPRPRSSASASSSLSAAAVAAAARAPLPPRLIPWVEKCVKYLSRY
jgi:hypothetical protein